MDWRIRIRARAGTFAIEAELAGDARPVAIVGPNGSGKTTLLRVVAGAHPADEGRIEVAGRVLFDASLGIDLPPEKRRAGYVPQGHGLFPHMTVAGNVAFGVGAGRDGRGGTVGADGTGERGEPYEREGQGEQGGPYERDAKAGARAVRRRVAALLETVGCAHLAERLPSEISGGESQRVALARALAAAPDILLMDEPLSAMDALARRELRAYLAEYLADWRRPALVVTHDLLDLRALAPRQVYVLEDGVVVQSGPPSAVAARPRTSFVAAFFQSRPSNGRRWAGASPVAEARSGP